MDVDKRDGLLDSEQAHMEAARFNALVQNLGELVTLHDASGVILYATPSTIKELGYPKEQIFGRNAFELIHPDDMPVVQHSFSLVLRSQNRGVPTEYRVRRADGAWVDVETIGTNFLNDPAIGGIILTSRIITERKRHERQLEAIAEMAGVLRTAPTRDELLPIILDQVIRLVAVDGAALVLREPASNETVISLGRGRSESWTGVQVRIGEGVSGRVIQTGETYLSADVFADPKFTTGLLIRRDGNEPVAAACLPLMAHDHIVGAIWVEKRHGASSTSAGISDEQLQLLRTIAEISGNAIHRATLAAQTQLRLHRLMALQTIDLAISRSVDLRLTLELLLGEITSRLGIDAADVLLMEPGGKGLWRAANRGFTTNFLMRADAGPGQSLRSRALPNRRIIHIEGESRGKVPAELRPIMRAEGFQSYCGLPLIASGRIVGVLELFQRSALPNDPEWVDYLDGLSAHVAFAVEKATLIQNLQRSNADLVQAYDDLIAGWSRAMAGRTGVGVEDMKRVTGMAMRLARIAGMEGEQLKHLWRGAMLRDVGKMALPDQTRPCTDGATAESQGPERSHPERAYELLSSIPQLRAAMDIPYCHHERWDGLGFPRGLKGNEIPLAAQIFSVVDRYDQLTSGAPQGEGLSADEAVERLRAEAGRAFSPAIVETFLRNLPAIVEGEG